MLDSSVDEDEGFHPQLPEIQEISQTKSTVNKNQGRRRKSAYTGAFYQMKTMKGTPLMSQLPTELNVPQEEEQTRRPHVEKVTKQTIKHKFHGDCKLIKQVFCQPTYQCIYHSAWKTQEEMTSRKIRLSSPFDSDDKMYNDVNPQVYKAQTQLSFDSSFQSGNLSHVFVTNKHPDHYYLLTHDDTNSYGYNQWFMFRVSNLPTKVCTFHIANMHKKTSLHHQGMKIAVFSEKDGRWKRGGEAICYYNAHLQRKHRPDTSYYCLSFEFTPRYSHDTIYFALNQPYTFSRLLNFLTDLKMTHQTIGHTHSNNPIIALKIETEQSKKAKQYVLVTARQHPEETVSSFACQGFLQEIVKPTRINNELKKKYIFVILPMLNADGVIYGNSRCNLAGLDINRQWGPEAFKQLNPETYYVWKYLRNIEKDGGKIAYLFDLHGHSKKQRNIN